MTSSGSLTAIDGAPMNGTYSVTGTATIAGNTYSGGTTASLELPVVTVTTTPNPDPLLPDIITLDTNLTADTSYLGAIDGAFYGPGGIETAGAVDATSTTATTNSFVGAYWADREVFSPF